jgi:hypothetical protein
VCREVVWLTMDLTSNLSNSLSQRSSARAFLGSDHPLTRVLEWLGTLLAHSLLVGLLLSASVAELVRGAPWALQVAVAAAIVEAALACVALLLGRHKRKLVLDLIIGGRGDLPFVAVKRQRRRLLDPRIRAKLAARIEGVIKEARATAPKPHLPRAAAPIHVAAASWPVGELRAIAGLLRRSPKDPSGVALTERLLMDGRSALYGRDVTALREEVNRVRFLLCA